MTELDPGSSNAQHSFGERFLGALKLDASIYREVEHDASALGQALGVVVIAAAATALGASAGGGSMPILGAAIGGLVGWLVSAWFVWVVGVRWMEHTSDYRELLRTLGFAAAPNVAMVLGLVPTLGPLFSLAAVVWGLVAYVVAVREALDVETGRAVLVCVLAYGLKVLVIVVLFGLLALLGGGGAGTG